jgi:hypothetical protein
MHRVVVARLPWYGAWEHSAYAEHVYFLPPDEMIRVGETWCSNAAYAYETAHLFWARSAAVSRVPRRPPCSVNYILYVNMMHSWNVRFTGTANALMGGYAVAQRVLGPVDGALLASLQDRSGLIWSARSRADDGSKRAIHVEWRLRRGGGAE